VISISGRRNYHYLLSGLVLEETWDSKVAEFGAINITGFRNRHLDNILVEFILFTLNGTVMEIHWFFIKNILKPEACHTKYNTERP
jgi:hypothetical protein